MILVHEKTEVPAKVGDKLTSFRGEPVTLVDWCEPRTSNSTGRVTVNEDSGQRAGSYYPSVYGLKFVEEQQ